MSDLGSSGSAPLTAPGFSPLAATGFVPLATSADHRQIIDAVRAVCDQFDDEYWSVKDVAPEFPHELAAAIAAGFHACDRDPNPQRHGLCPRISR